MGFINKLEVGELFNQPFGPARTARIIRVGENLFFSEPPKFADLAVFLFNRHNGRAPETLDDTFEIVAGALSEKRVYIRGKSRDPLQRKRTTKLMKRELEPEVEVFDFTNLSSPITKQ